MLGIDGFGFFDIWFVVCCYFNIDVEFQVVVVLEVLVGDGEIDLLVLVVVVCQYWIDDVVVVFEQIMDFGFGV